YLYAHYQYGAPVTSHIHFYYTAPTVLYTLSLHDALPILAEFRAPEILRLQAGLAEVALAADVDAPDRAGRPLQARHHAERSQRIDRGLREAEVALVEHLRHRGRGRGLEQGRGHAGAVERERQAGADEAAADDQHVVDLQVCHGAASYRQRPDRQREAGVRPALARTGRMPGFPTPATIAMTRPASDTPFAPGPLVLTAMILL